MSKIVIQFECDSAAQVKVYLEAPAFRKAMLQLRNDMIKEAVYQKGQSSLGGDRAVIEMQAKLEPYFKEFY